MKKFFAIIMVIMFIGVVFNEASNADDSVLFGVTSNSGDNIIKLPENSSELIGKIISFTDKTNSRRSV